MKCFFFVFDRENRFTERIIIRNHVLLNRTKKSRYKVNSAAWRSKHCLKLHPQSVRNCMWMYITKYTTHLYTIPSKLEAYKVSYEMFTKLITNLKWVGFSKTWLVQVSRFWFLQIEEEKRAILKLKTWCENVTQLIDWNDKNPTVLCDQNHLLCLLCENNKL